jgi:hypothetical protein
MNAATSRKHIVASTLGVNFGLAVESGTRKSLSLNSQFVGTRRNLIHRDRSVNEFDPISTTSAWKLFLKPLAGHNNCNTIHQPSVSYSTVAKVMRLIRYSALAILLAFTPMRADLSPEQINKRPHAEIEKALPKEHPASYYLYAGRLFREGN